MAQKFLDLTDLTTDLHEFKVPFIKDGKQEDRNLVVTDPKTSMILVFEQLKEKNAEVQEGKKKGEDMSLEAQKEYLHEMAFLLFATDNNVTRAEIETIPYSVLLNLMNWLKNYMKEVFLGDSPISSKKGSSSSKKSKTGSKSKKPTKSSE